MALLDLTHPAYSLLGFCVGLLVGLTGVGGGSLMTPLLILIFGIYPVTAVGTDLLFAAATKTVGTLIHGMNHTVEWRLTGLLTLGSLPATAGTLAIVSHFELQDQYANRVVTGVLFAALVLTACSLLARRRIEAFAFAHIGALSPRLTALLTVLTGVGVGVMVSLSSIGAGALGIVALILLYPKLPTARIVGSDVAHAVPLTLLAGLGHWAMGSVNWVLLGSLLTGSLPGIVVGSFAAPRVPDGVLRAVLAVVLLVVAGRMLV
jgi:uncharacterized protein